MAATDCRPGLRLASGPLGQGVRRVHMVGIAGAGMEGLARLLGDLGYTVSGSDAAAGAVGADLRRAGVAVHDGHDEAHVGGVDLLIYSAAIGETNHERRAARRQGIPQRTRAEVLGSLSRLCDTVAVAGTHGKTTTASLLATAARIAGRDPAVAIGGWVGGRTQACSGAGALLVAEADEYQRSFLHLESWIAVVTNIETEHVDCYSDEEDLVETFAAFLRRNRSDGGIVINGDDPLCAEALVRAGAPAALTFGSGVECDVRAEALSTAAAGSTFDVVIGARRQSVALRIPGRHNVDNALAAAAAAELIGLDGEALAAAAAQFVGVDRRFQDKGVVRGVRVIDDYAHHPTEVAAAVTTARQAGDVVHAVFQPHTYSRTRHFHGAFAAALASADRICVTSVYAARETPGDGDEGDVIFADLRRLGHRHARFEADPAQSLSMSLDSCDAGDLLLVMGAGDIGAHLDALLAEVA